MEHLVRGIICGVTLSVAVVAAAWAREPIMGSISKHAGTPCVAGQEPQNDRKGLERRQKAPSGPHMAFDRTSHDFGDVARHGGDLIKEFRFVNDGDEPLVIKKITKACSCLTVSYSRKPVLPGEASVIKIKYEPHKIEEGIFHRVIQIYSNSPEGVRLLTIQGNSIEDNTSRKRH